MYYCSAVRVLCRPISFTGWVHKRSKTTARHFP